MNFFSVVCDHQLVLPGSGNECLRRAQGFEFALACDMRFASKERAKFALTEVGGSSIPGGGGVEWLSALVGRSRTLEIVCSADDFDADIGERYGFVNRSIPDAELDAFVDALAERMGRFESARWRPARKWSTGVQAFRQKAIYGPRFSSRPEHRRPEAA